MIISQKNLNGLVLLFGNDKQTYRAVRRQGSPQMSLVLFHGVVSVAHPRINRKLQLFLLASDAGRVDNHKAAVGHTSPPLGGEKLAFFFFYTGIIAQNIDLIFFNLLQGLEAQTSGNISVIVRGYGNGTGSDVAALKIGKHPLDGQFFFQRAVLVVAAFSFMGRLLSIQTRSFLHRENRKFSSDISFHSEQLL